MIDFIIDILLWIMSKTHYVTQTWAIDIILLTILVRMAMYPLNRKMNRSMKLMQKLQPEMKAIQAKYKDKPDVQQKEIMELYKKYKVNPFSSCFPLLLQMPIFISLFWALRDSRFFLRLPGFEDATLFGIKLTIPPLLSHPYPEVALKAGVLDLFNLGHIGFFADRFLYLPTLWLVVIYIATTIIQSRQMQASSQSGQSGPNTMTFMLPLFILFGLLFPTGLLAYFITSNVLQMGQYWKIQREIALEEGTIEDLKKTKKGSRMSNKTSKNGNEGTGSPNRGRSSGESKKKK